MYHKTNILETFFNIFAAQKKKDSSEMLSSTFVAQKKKDSSEMLSSTFVAQKKKDSSEMLSSTFVAQDKTSISAMLFLYVQRRAAQHCFAADAAGAAPELGVIVWHRGVPALVPVCGGGQRRR